MTCRSIINEFHAFVIHEIQLHSSHRPPSSLQKKTTIMHPNINSLLLLTLNLLSNTQVRFCRKDLPFYDAACYAATNRRTLCYLSSKPSGSQYCCDNQVWAMKVPNWSRLPYIIMPLSEYEEISENVGEKKYKREHKIVKFFLLPYLPLPNINRFLLSIHHYPHALLTHTLHLIPSPHISQLGNSLDSLPNSLFLSLLTKRPPMYPWTLLIPPYTLPYRRRDVFSIFVMWNFEFGGTAVTPPDMF